MYLKSINQPSNGAGSCASRMIARECLSTVRSGKVRTVGPRGHFEGSEKSQTIGAKPRKQQTRIAVSQTGRKLLEFLAPQKAPAVGMEACATAHYWGREIQRLGQRVKLIHPR